MTDNTFPLMPVHKAKRYTVERAIIESKQGDKMRYLILDDGVPATTINKHLLIKQEKQAHPSSSSAYNLCQFLNAMKTLNIGLSDVTLSTIYDYLHNYFVKGGKSHQTIMSYIYDVSALYESLALRNYPIDTSLLRPVYDDSSGPRVKRNRKDKFLTNISLLKSEFMRKKNRDMRPTYTKWYSGAEIEAIAAELPLVHRCIFLDTIFTGHRIDSALSLTLDTVSLKRHEVYPTRSKTGKTHISAIPTHLVNLMQTYLYEERRKILESTGSISLYFFLNSKGEPVKYSAYYIALKRAGERAAAKNPHLSIENLHTHAGRSTFAAVLRSFQLDQRRQGKVTFSDADFCALMDWKSLSSLENYDITTRAQEVSPLLKDFYAQYLPIADATSSRPILTNVTKEV